MTEHNLDAIYREAQSALKSRDYVRARELLRQILVVDENYRDVSRLLAQTVKLKRRRWYNDPRLWGALGLVMIVAFGFLIAPRLRGLYAVQPSATVAATSSPTATLTPTSIVIATETLLPTPTPIPLTWKRVSMGQEFQRDTVTAFATDKKDPDVIYAAMMNAGVYKTIDGGLSWRPAHYGLASTQVKSLLINSQNPHILYAVTMGGVFKTEDGGENWHRIGDGTALLMDPQNNSHLYARDENGIYETTDQGNTWTSAYTLNKECPDAISSWAIHPADGNMLFIGGGETCAGVYQSKDSGDTWALLGLRDKLIIDHLAIGLDKEGDFSIYISHFDFESPTIVGPERGMYASDDGGANWSFTHGVLCEILNSDPNDPSTIYCAGYGLSIKRGKGSWQSIPGTNSRFHSAVHIDSPNGIERIITGALYVSMDNPYVGIFISTDGGASWTKRNGGLGSARLELKIDPMNSARIYLAAYYKGNMDNCALYSSQNSGKNWSAIKGKADWCGPIFDAANAFYLIEAGALQMSSNGGETWLWNSSDPKWMSNNPDPRKNIDPARIFALPSYYGEGSQSISANPYIDGLIYAAGNNIYYSTIGGGDWQLSEGNEGSWDGRLFYTDQGKMIYAIGRYHQKYSTDNGKTWQGCGEDVTTSRSDTRLALDIQSSRLYLATPDNGVLISTDNCQSWQASNEGLSNLFVNTLAIDPNNINTIYAGTDGGAYLSNDGGQSWGQVNDGLLGATVVYSIVVDKDSNVYAATPYGVFKLENK